MTGNGRWQPLSRPARGTAAASFVLSPFAKLARAHALSVAGDTLIAIALAGSLFFSIDPSDARWKVFLYLALTMAPFAIVAPLIGPFLDRTRGGRRWMVVGANAGRAIVCLFMLDDLDSLLLFPQAFTVLVLGKAYNVARAALVPTVVSTDGELVEANSKLQLLSGLVGFAAAAPAGLAYLAAGARGVLVLAVVVFVAAALAGLRIPSTQVAATPESDAERTELRGIGILLAASAMGLIRGIVGFLTFLLAFDLRSGDAPTWHFGVVLACTGVGALFGSAIAPVLRRSHVEERILSIVLGLTVVSGLATAYLGGLLGASLIAATVGIASTTGKLAFDSLVQRDAPDANRGRSFARFETRFQLIWVLGAVPPVLVDMPARLGFLIVGGTAAFALFSYLAGERTAARAGVDRPPRGPGIPPADDLAGAPDAATAGPFDRPRVPPDPTTVVDPTAVRPGHEPTQVEPRPPTDPTQYF